MSFSYLYTAYRLLLFLLFHSFCRQFGSVWQWFLFCFVTLYFVKPFSIDTHYRRLRHESIGIDVVDKGKYFATFPLLCQQKEHLYVMSAIKTFCMYDCASTSLRLFAVTFRHCPAHRYASGITVCTTRFLYYIYPNQRNTSLRLATSISSISMPNPIYSAQIINFSLGALPVIIS